MAGGKGGKGAKARRGRERGADVQGGQVEGGMVAARRLWRSADAERGAARYDLLRQAHVAVMRAVEAGEGESVPGRMESLRRMVDCAKDGGNDPNPSATAEAERLSRAQWLRQAMIHLEEILAVQATQSDGADAGVLNDVGNTQNEMGETLIELYELGGESVELKKRGKEEVSKAARTYEKSLALKSDKDVHHNLCQMIVRLGELDDDDTASSLLFSRAWEEYQKLFGSLDATNGDDVPGVLMDWGIGLASCAERAPGLEDAARLTEESCMKLELSASFMLGNVAPLISLGEARMSLAERLWDAGEVDPCITCASVAAEKGFKAAFRIDNKNSDALGGMGDASLMLTRCASKSNKATDAKVHANEAIEAYKRLLELPPPHNITGVEDRGTVEYNMGCAFALIGESERARWHINRVLNMGVTTQQEISEDDDLIQIRPPG